MIKPDSLEFIEDSNVEIEIEIANYQGPFVLYLDDRLVLNSTLHSIDGREVVKHSESNLKNGLHRAYGILYPAAAPPLEASVQFYVLQVADRIEYLRQACINNELFSIGISNPCDGIFQTGHELRLNRKYDEAEVLLLDTIHYQKEAIAYPYLELAQLYREKGNVHAAKQYFQIVERLYPGYIPAKHISLAPKPTHPSVVTIDLRDLENESLQNFAHLMCLWSGMIITRHAGIRDGKGSAMHAGNHYRLLRRIAKQFKGGVIIELGTLHAAATIALAGDGSNHVISFNVLDDLQSNLNRCGITKEEFQGQVPGRTDFLIADATDDDHLDMLAKADVLFIDTNHHGDVEDRVYQYLSGIGWQGIMILDDIFLNADMDAWWGSVTLPKYDLTDFAHTATGTGIIDFANRIQFIY